MSPQSPEEVSSYAACTLIPCLYASSSLLPITYTYVYYLGTYGVMHIPAYLHMCRLRITRRSTPYSVPPNSNSCPADDPRTGSRSPKLGSAQPKLEVTCRQGWRSYRDLQLECEHRCNIHFLSKISSEIRNPFLSSRNFQRVPQPPP
jgi:hypothetical protein